MSSLDGLGMRRHAAAGGLLAAGGLGLLIYFFVLESVAARDVAFVAFGAAASAAILVGIRWHRPEDRRPWMYWLAATVSYTLAQVAYWYQEVIVGSLAPFPSMTDILMLARYPLITVGLLLAVRRRAPTADRESLVDGLIIAASVGSFALVELEPLLREVDADLAMRITAIGFPALSLLVVAVAARLLIGEGQRGAVLGLLSAAVLVDLFSSVAYGALALTGAYETGHLVDAGLLAAPLLWAVAALHPSMGNLTAPAKEPRRQWAFWRLALLAGAVAITPAAVLVGWLRDQPVPSVVAIAGTGLVAILVVVRLALVIDELRARTTALRRREAHYRLLADSARDVVYLRTLRPVPHTSYMSPSVERSLGYPVEEWLDDPSFAATLVHPEDRAVYETAIEDPTEKLLQVRMRHADGGWRWMEHHLSPVQDERGAVEAIHCIARDITELKELDELRRQSQEALRHSEQQYRSLVEHARDVVFRYRVGDDPGFEYLSPSVEEITGYTQAELEGLDGVAFQRVAEEDRDKLLATLSSSGPDFLSHVLRWTKPDGRTVWLEENVVKIRDDEGRLVAVDGIIRDVTRRVEDQRRLERINEELRAATKIRDDFLALASHELRTPLTPMIGFIELLRSRWDDFDASTAAHVLDTMERQTTRMHLLVDDLLTMTELSSGTLSSQHGVVSVAPLLRSVVTRWPGREIAVTCEPDLEVITDQDQLRQMVTNLVRNAVTYGAAPFRVSAQSVGRSMELRVCDGGAGVPAHLEDSVFDRFTQADAGDTRSAKGVGLGLAVCRGLAEQHGGEVWYERARGSTSFVIRLPLTPDPEPDEEDDDADTALLSPYTTSD